MSNGIKIDGNVAYLPGAHAVVSMPGFGAPPGAQPKPTDNTANHTKSVVKVTTNGVEQDIPYAVWGSGNNRPQLIVAEVNKSGIAKAGLTVRRKAHYGSGPLYYRAGVDGEKELSNPIPLTDPALKAPLAFHKAVRLEMALMEGIMNYEWWGWMVPEYVLSNDGKTITSMRVLKTAWSRWSLMNEETGRIEWLLYNPNWDLYDSAHCVAVPVAEPWMSVEEVKAWAKANGYKKFVRPVAIPDPDAGYYVDLDWHALYDNGWMKSTNNIPAMKQGVMLNQISLKYHIKIPATYWRTKFGDAWEALDMDEKEAKKKEVLTLLNTWLTGAENAGKAFFSEYGVDEMGQPLPGWEITALDDKLKDGAYIPDAEKGNSEILASMLVDPTLLGQSGIAGAGAGSGSDKREAYTILNALLNTDRDTTLDPWYFVRDFNGWDPTLELGYRQVTLTTLDKNPTGAQKTMQA